MNNPNSAVGMPPVAREDVANLQAEQSGLELDLIDEVLGSRQRAWHVAVGFFVLAICCVAALLFVIYRYSQPIPTHLLFQDQHTGAVGQISLTAEQNSYGEVNDSYWVSQFVIHHEGYDFYSAQVDYDAVGLMAAGPVADEYRKRFAGPNGLDKVLGDSERTKVEISSVILDRASGIATVRYATEKKIRIKPQAERRQYWIAQVSYTYDNILLTAKQRYINPLGFRVRSFRVNAENVGG